MSYESYEQSQKQFPPVTAGGGGLPSPFEDWTFLSTLTWDVTDGLPPGIITVNDFVDTPGASTPDQWVLTMENYITMYGRAGVSTGTGTDTECNRFGGVLTPPQDFTAVILALELTDNVVTGMTQWKCLVTLTDTGNTCAGS